ncbi:MAG: hypothetical protein AAB036_11505 [Elusimicrobiota bacterium]
MKKKAPTFYLGMAIQLALLQILPPDGFAQSRALLNLRAAAGRLGATSGTQETLSRLFDASATKPDMPAVLGSASPSLHRVSLKNGAVVPVPDQMTVMGVPPIAEERRRLMAPYLEARTAVFQGWHPKRREMLIVTRFGETNQLHWVKQAGADRRQLTFLQGTVMGGAIQPIEGRYVVFSVDKDGSENFQLHRLDLNSGAVTQLTDGKSRNEYVAFSKDGKLIAYSSTQRNGKDYDIHVMDPENPESDRLSNES